MRISDLEAFANQNNVPLAYNQDNQSPGQSMERQFTIELYVFERDYEKLQEFLYYNCPVGIATDIIQVPNQIGSTQQALIEYKK